jgi:hypothetical protein
LKLDAQDWEAIHASHAADQARAKAEVLAHDGIFERIEAGAEESRSLAHPFRERTSSDLFLFGREAKKARKGRKVAA